MNRRDMWLQKLHLRTPIQRFCIRWYLQVYMWGLRGRYFSTPPSPCPHMQMRDIAIAAIVHFRKIGCYPFVAPMVDKSQGRSVRMPNKLKAAPHFCGGRALVNMSAAWYLVSTYWIDTLSSAKISDKHERFTLWVREICRSFGLYPFFTTKIVAWLSSTHANGALEKQLP